MTNDFMEAVQKLAAGRVLRPCANASCQYIKAAIIEMMIPYIAPLAQTVENKARECKHGSMSEEEFVADVLYEVMATMGKFAGTSVQTTMDVCNACTQAASIEKGERH